MSSRLAVRGGPRAIAQQDPHFVWPEISADTHEAVARQLDESVSIYNRSGVVERLENRLQSHHARRRALLTNSGTAALHSMFVACGLGAGDEVICPAYTFFATVTPLLHTGAVPVLADAGPDGNVDPEDVERRITPRTRAIVVTHVWGVPCDMGRLVEIAQRHDLMLLEDGSHAHGSTFQGRLVGTFGRASAFSLQGQKPLTGGEGGFLLTDDDDVYFRSLLFGHYNKRCKDEIPAEHPLRRFHVTGMGLKLRVHPLGAAIALQQYDRLDAVLDGRRRVAARLDAGLRGLAGLRIPVVDDRSSPSWYGYVMQYRSEELGGLPISRFHEAMIAEGASELDRPGSTCPLNLLALFQEPEVLFPSYAGVFRYGPGDFPAAERFHSRALKLPVWHDAKDDALVDAYIAAFRKVIEHHGELL